MELNELAKLLDERLAYVLDPIKKDLQIIRSEIEIIRNDTESTAIKPPIFYN